MYKIHQKEIFVYSIKWSIVGIILLTLIFYFALI